jgi:steroid delta-isomerase-like uncharacterized protein
MATVVVNCCADGSEGGWVDSTDNKAFIRRYLETALRQVRDGDPSATDAYLTEGATYYDPGRPPSVGREAQKQRSAALLGAFPDVEFVIEDLVAEDDKVAARWLMRATHGGPFAGVPPTERRITMSGTTIYRLAGGRIAEAWSDIDQLGLLQQIGALPVSGP